MIFLSVFLILELIMLFVLVLNYATNKHNNQTSKNIVYHFTPIEKSDNLTEMINYFQTNETINYKIRTYERK